MFHGSSGNGEQFLRISGWREQADATGLIAVFPTGLRYRVLDSGRRHATKWNGFDLAGQVDLADKPPGYPADAPWPADDVGFTDAILADLTAQLPIDERRDLRLGFSNGAEFTARLAVERSTTIAAAGLGRGRPAHGADAGAADPDVARRRHARRRRDEPDRRARTPARPRRSCWRWRRSRAWSTRTWRPPGWRGARSPRSDAAARRCCAGRAPAIRCCASPCSAGLRPPLPERQPDLGRLPRRARVLEVLPRRHRR